MKAALDVDYGHDSAVAACVIFQAWPDSEPLDIVRKRISEVKPYRAGRFYERELPCLLAVLEEVGRKFDSIAIDGFVHLRSDEGKGLGRHLYDALPYSPAVIGVAKNPLKIAANYVPVFRGRSGKPLYVSAVGCPLDRAALSIAHMHGPHRIPTLLSLADRAARNA